MVLWHDAFAGGIHQRLQLLPAWTPLSDLTSSHGDLRGFARAGGTFVDDLPREGQDLIEGAGVRVGRHGGNAVTSAQGSGRRPDCPGVE